MASTVTSTKYGTPGPTSHIRIARPSRDFEAAKRFYVNGLGLSILWEASADAVGGHALLMMGWPGAAWHPELVLTQDIKAAPTEEDMLVIYLGGSIDSALIENLLAAGGKRVTSSNPYWEQWGVTIIDPDEYRLVLCRQRWNNVVEAPTINDPSDRL
jgi:catechol 2,3-dioxygenase-like lactoylglutathione lyase family enzyme